MADIRLHNIDCMEFMKGVSDKAYDLAIVDPEYGINVAARKNYGRRASGKVTHTNTGKSTYLRRNDYTPKNWDKKAPSPEYFSELRRISVNQIIWGWNYFKLDWGPGLIKWNKLQPEGVSFGSFEYAYCSLLDRQIDITYMWAGMFQGESLLNPFKVQGNKALYEKRIHPTQKPVIIYKWLLSKFANKADKIIDTHLGSGSIAIACHDMGFSLVACEKDSEYYMAAKRRLTDHQSQQKLFQ